MGYEIMDLLLECSRCVILKVSCMNEIPSCIRHRNNTHGFIHIENDAIGREKIVLIATDESLYL
jgi:hypothetical protein